MAAFEYLLIALSAFGLAANGYLLSELSDYRDYDVSCVAEYLRSQHKIPIRFKMQPKQGKYCKQYIEEFDESFYESVGHIIVNDTRRECVTSLLMRHRVSEVLFKAVGFNYFRRQLVNFSPNETCEGIVNVLRVDNDCELAVNFIGGDKSLRKLRPCLDDLFGEFNVDEIVFVNQASTRLGKRRFGKHLSSFLQQLAEAGSTFCSDLDLDLAIKYSDIFFLKNAELERIYNQTQLECFENYFISHRFVESSAYRFSKAVPLRSDPVFYERCERIMQEQVESVIVVDLFGFTEPSRRVKDCVVRRNAGGKLIEQVILMPAIARYIDFKDFDIPRSIHHENTKRIIELTLDCLHEF